MLQITESSGVFISGKLPQTEQEWLQLNGIDDDHLTIDGGRVHYATFAGSVNTDELTLFVGGIPRDAARRDKLPVINKLFGFVASGLAQESTIGVTFNWPGLGQSDGNILASTINGRVDFLKSLSMQLMHKHGASKINYVGASMGAYCATLAAADKSINAGKLVLLSPPAYPAGSHGISYADGFGEVLRKPWDVEQSPVFDGLDNPDTPALVAYSEVDDPPIPRSIQDEYAAVARDTPHISFHTIPGVGHNFRRLEITRSGNIVDNEAVRKFGKKVVAFLG